MAITERPEIDLLDGAFYVGDPYTAYAWMREHEPVYRDAVNELWGVARYDDVVEIEKHKDTFINSDQAKGGLPAQHPGRPVDHRPGRPPPLPSPQPGVAPLHPQGRVLVGGPRPGHGAVAARRAPWATVAPSTWWTSWPRRSRRR